ncbi:MAG: hypothetical protein N3G21_07855 [Candidatus Hydrogenedentes bacterium]|nr:hypothetical protein [Candidatus Hydrogenedentota bacterium]
MANITLCIITGSGINLSNILNKKVSEEPFKEIFPKFQGNIKGHDYKITRGYIGVISTIICAGRIHAYEGYDWNDFNTFLEMFKRFGVTNILSINAVGSIDEKLKVPSYTIVKEIIPTPFVKYPLEKPLTPNWNIKADLPKSTYIWVTGPSYETKSELKLFKQIGGDIIGMSGAPELYWALQLNYKVAMLSCVTNYCFNSSPITHDEVIKNAKQATENLLPHLKGIIIKNLNPE